MRAETFHALYDGRSEDKGRNKANFEGRDCAGIDRRKVESSSNKEGEGRSAGRINAFVVPRPSKYVSDWAAFGPSDKEHGESATQRGEVRLRQGRRSVEFCVYDSHASLSAAYPMSAEVHVCAYTVKLYVV